MSKELINTEDFIFHSEDFRDSIATVSKEGERIWIYPKKPSGQWYNYRKWVSYFLLLILFVLPFVKINSRPLFLFNIIERKFIIWGIVFHPQDLHLFLFTLLTSFLFIILFTVVYGRLFCGWVCPQTIFMEMVFRRIEYFIEGDWQAQMKLDKSPMNFNKFSKKLIKHILFFGISFIISNLFLSYIIGIDTLIKIITEPVSLHITGLIMILIFTCVFYGVFAYMREQVCTTVCPYGRLQGVMLDKNSIVISYDWIRGEPRGKIRKNEQKAESKGDCIDCGLCIKVCPTGIDIRNGTQLECINCTACIDACDDVMTKISKPKGLIRYDSHNGISQSKTNIFSKRTIAYSAVLISLIIFTIFLYSYRSDVESTILKAPGSLYIEEGDKISNMYTYEFLNKTDELQRISIDIINLSNAEISIVGNQKLEVEKGNTLQGTMFIKIPKNIINNHTTKIKLKIKTNDREHIYKTKFIGPFK